jgi:membrane-bound serine protease (ClpP class)
MARRPVGARGCDGKAAGVPPKAHRGVTVTPGRRIVPRFTSRSAVLASALGLFAALSTTTAHAASPTVEVAHLSGAINAVTANYIGTAVSRAAGEHAGALVVVMDTPGGISTAMDDIVASLLNAPVPVAVYVAPSGARAASAGLFVAQAADVLAMAPGTNIGSAHPVTGSGGDITGDLGRKVLNDSVARVRNLAALHQRNADWCEKAVRDSVNIGADEAVQIGVADLQAPTMDALLRDLDGRTAHRSNGRELTFHTAGASISDQPMSIPEQLLQALIDPNVAYLLMLVAIFGLIAEVSTPGAILPGVIGGISAILALVALSTLPLNLAGILLVGFAFLLFVIDIKAPTHGVLTLGGLVSLLIGSTFLFNTGPVDLGVDWRLIVALTLAVTAGFFFIVRKAVRARSSWSGSRAAALVGTLGEARGAIDPTGQVFVAGALWPAASAGGRIPSGAQVRVVGQEGGSLRVEPAADAASVGQVEQRA